MNSFQRLWENMQAAKNEEAVQDDRAMSAIRTGIGVRDEFWDDFLAVLNNSQDLSELLDIPVEKISSWRGKIQNALEKVRDADSDPEQKKNGKLMKTGLPEDLGIDSEEQE
jgi:hypothetical protein